MKKISGVYKISSLIKPERIYIGSSFSIYKRWEEHLRSLKGKYHHSKKLQRHYDKYGKNDLQFSILLGCDVGDLLSSEQYFIDSHSPYFNICGIAGSTLGRKASEETKAKMRLRRGPSHPMYGRPKTEKQIKSSSGPRSEEVRKRMSEGQYKRYERPEEIEKARIRNTGRPSAMKGRHPSPEAILKSSEANKGRIPWNKGKKGVLSVESIQRMSEANKRKSPPSEETKQKLSESIKKSWELRRAKITDETKIKMSEVAKKREALKRLKKQINSQELTICN